VKFKVKDPTLGLASAVVPACRGLSAAGLAFYLTKSFPLGRKVCRAGGEGEGPGFVLRCHTSELFPKGVQVVRAAKGRRPFLIVGLLQVQELNTRGPTATS